MATPNPEELANENSALLLRIKELESTPPESSFSMNWSMIDDYGADVTCTMRAATLSDMRVLFEKRKSFMDYNLAHGWKLRGKLTPAPERDTTPTQSTQPANPSNTKPVHTNSPTSTFEAETLEGSVSGGKSYWKVKGGKFKKYGVTIWPEVLDASGFSSLEKGSEYSLKGYVAHYTEKEDGKPDKVVKLEKF